ncbi:MAG: 4-alpha-glucanotransferase, partial [Pseudomonadota bacterium]|nr:4-alpha-glucanotransferase [Pseudomonadota bacterium]
RNRCLVVGEALGTVPEGFRERLAAEGVFSNSIFMFERYDNGLFKRPDTYERQALAAVDCHDLPTLAGMWEGADLAQRREIGLIKDDAALAAAQHQRAEDRQALLGALADQNLLSDGIDLASPDTAPTEAVNEGVHRFIARSPAALVSASLDDLLGEMDQINIPGTVREYPNWRRKYALPLEDLENHPQFRAITKALAEERPRSDDFSGHLPVKSG